MLKYKDETINNALMLLNNLEIKGIENAKRVALISQLLRATEKGETEDGKLQNRARSETVQRLQRTPCTQQCRISLCRGERRERDSERMLS